MTRFKTIPSSGEILGDRDVNASRARQIRNKRTRANAPIYNDFFSKMAETIEDPFWRERLQKGSEGVFPPNISYMNGILQHKGDVESLLTINTEVSSKEEIMFEALRVIEFLQSKLEMYSSLDFKNFFENDLNNIEENVGNLWSKIKPRQRTISLVDFMKNEKSKRNLSREQYLELEQLINICRVLKYINSDTVHVEKNKIVNQIFLGFDETTQKYFINPSISKNTKFKPQKKKVKKVAQSYADKWIEFQKSTLEKDASHGPLPHLRNYKFPQAEPSEVLEDSSTEVSET